MDGSQAIQRAITKLVKSCLRISGCKLRSHIVVNSRAPRPAHLAENRASIIVGDQHVVQKRCINVRGLMLGIPKIIILILSWRW